MFRLTLRTLRFRTGGFAASFVALFLGVLIVTACGGLMETGIRTDVSPKRLADAPIVVSGDRSYQLPAAGDPERVTLPEQVRLDADLVTAVLAVPGVATAVADVSFPVAVLGLAGEVIEVDQRPAGHGWSSASLAPYPVSAGRAPTSPAEIVLDTRLANRVGAATGSAVDLQVRGQTERFQVVGLVTARTDLPAAVFFSDPYAERTAQRRIDHIAVFPVPGTDTGQLRERIVTALHGHSLLYGRDVTVATGSERGRAEFADARPASEIIIAMSAVFGGLAIMVVVFVVASTLGLSVQQRQREMALLRIIGTTPGQLRRMVLGEAVLVSGLAIALAQPAGDRVGRALFARLTEHEVAPPEIAFQQGWIPAAAGAGVGLLTAVVAAFIAVRAAATARPAENLTEASLHNRPLGWIRIVAGLLSLAGATALALVTAIVMPGKVAASTAGPSAMLWAGGFALLGPSLAPAVTGVLRPVLRAASRTAGHLASLNLRARRTRTAAAIAPVMLATGLAIGLIYLQTSQTAQARRDFDESLRADAVITSSTGELPLNLVDAVRAVSGVAAASALMTSVGYIETPRFAGQSDDGLPLRGVSTEGTEATTAARVAAGTLTDLHGNTIALDSAHAKEIGPGVGVGDTVTLRLGDGARVDLRVVALVSMQPEARTALLPAPLLAGHTTAGTPAQVLVRAAPGVGHDRLAAALAGLVEQQPGLRVADRAAVTAAYAQQEQTGAWINYMFVGMIIAYTVISLINTMIIATTERRREFALQRLVGAGRGQLLRMMGIEALVIATTGIFLGVVVSTLTLVPFGIALNGSPVPSGPLSIGLTVIGAVAALTLAASLLSTWFALRPRPTRAAAGQA